MAFGSLVFLLSEMVDASSTDSSVTAIITENGSGSMESISTQNLQLVEDRNKVEAINALLPENTYLTIFWDQNSQTSCVVVGGSTDLFIDTLNKAYNEKNRDLLKAIGAYTGVKYSYFGVNLGNANEVVLSLIKKVLQGNAINNETQNQLLRNQQLTEFQQTLAVYGINDEERAVWSLTNRIFGNNVSMFDSSKLKELSEKRQNLMQFLANVPNNSSNLNALEDASSLERFTRTCNTLGTSVLVGYYEEYKALLSYCLISKSKFVSVIQAAKRDSSEATKLSQQTYPLPQLNGATVTEEQFSTFAEALKQRQQQQQPQQH